MSNYDPLALGGLVEAAEVHTASRSTGTTNNGGASSGNNPKKRGSPEEHGANGGGAGSAKRKIARQALSCVECKRRKIRCDRKIPCESCIKRGKPDDCSWDETRIEPEPQPFALASDHRRLIARLAQVEAFLHALPHELKINAPPLPSGILSSSAHHGPSIRSSSVGNSSYSPGFEHDHHEDAVEQADSDTEEAAIALEGAAFSTRPAFNATRSSALIGGKAPLPHELTKALTCIVARPIMYETDPWISVDMGLDIGISVADLPAARAAALEKIYALFPTKDESYHLVKEYFGTIAWLQQTLDEAAFMAELDRFWEMCESGRKLDVCPTWLSLYSMVLAIATDGAVNVTPQGKVVATTRAPLFYAAALRLLDLGQWKAVPQVRTIMTILLVMKWHQVSTPAVRSPVLLVWLGSAIRQAQILGLHVLGDDPEIMPPDDPAWPPGKNSIKRQSALRLWNILAFNDCAASTPRFRAYMIHEQQCTSGPPANVDDSELSMTTWEIKPKPKRVMTSASVNNLKHEVASQTKLVFDQLQRASSPAFTYDTVLSLDAGYRRILDELPDLISTEHGTLEAEHPRLTFQRHLAQASLHARILRLHRPFLTRGYAPGSQFRYSMEECLRSARLVVELNHSIRDAMRSFSFTYSHVLASTIVLFADLFRSIDHDLPQQEADEKRTTLLKSQEIFQPTEIASPALRTVVRQSSKIISALFLEAEMRRAGRAATGKGGKTTSETFAQILHRISREVYNPPDPSTIHKSASTMHPASFPLSAPSYSTSSVAPSFGNTLSTTSTTTPNSDVVQYDGTFSAEFFRELGLPMSDSPPTSLDYWTASASAAAPGLGGGGAPSMMPDYSYLGSSLDWGAGGLLGGGVGAVGEGVPANALLEQLTGTW